MRIDVLTDAIYHILIPFEEQDVQVQKENREAVRKAATAAFESFHKE